MKGSRLAHEAAGGAVGFARERDGLADVAELVIDAAAVDASSARATSRATS